jgi:hypothetical protein
MSEYYDNMDATRALQESAAARQDNYRQMVAWGAYSLLKVCPKGAPRTTVANYITVQAALSGSTPRQMEKLLGLRAHQLAGGADIYRLRQYSTLVDGLHLKAGLTQDAAGYRPGLGAWQITLIKDVPADRIATLGYDEVFEPGVHPKYRR